VCCKTFDRGVETSQESCKHPNTKSIPCRRVATFTFTTSQHHTTIKKRQPSQEHHHHKSNISTSYIISLPPRPLHHNFHHSECQDGLQATSPCRHRHFVTKEVTAHSIDNGQRTKAAIGAGHRQKSSSSETVCQRRVS